MARVLVEVDISKKHAKEIWVGSKHFGYMQKVDFEKVSEFCSHCKMHGHGLSECFKLHPELKKTVNNNVEKHDLPVKTNTQMEGDHALVNISTTPKNSNDMSIITPVIPDTDIEHTALNIEEGIVSGK